MKNTDSVEVQQLFTAIEAGDVSGIEKLVGLLEHGANVRRADGTSALAWAVTRAPLEAIQKLITFGADPAGTTGKAAQPVLSYGIQHGWGKHDRRPSLELLVRAGAKLDAVDARGYSAVHVAAFVGSMPTYSEQITKFLVAAGANVNAKDQRGRTPLHIACTTIAKETVAALLTAGADVNITDAQGKTPLHVAVESFSDMVELDQTTGERQQDTANYVQQHHVRALLRYGANPNAQDSEGTTPLGAAIAQPGYPEGEIRFLLENGASAACKVVAGGRYLGCLGAALVQRYSVATIGKLIQCTADPAEAVEFFGGAAPIHVACFKFPDVAEALVGTNPRLLALADPKGNTPLHIAAKHGHEWLVHLLLDLGAELAAKNAEGKTPEDLAQEAARAEIASFLHARGAA